MRYISYLGYIEYIKYMGYSRYSRYIKYMRYSRYMGYMGYIRYMRYIKYRYICNLNKEDHNDYDCIFSFNLSTKQSQFISSTPKINFAVGRNPRLLLTDNDKYLHIIAGQNQSNRQSYMILLKQCQIYRNMVHY